MGNIKASSNAVCGALHMFNTMTLKKTMMKNVSNANIDIKILSQHSLHGFGGRVNDHWFSP